MPSTYQRAPAKHAWHNTRQISIFIFLFLSYQPFFKNLTSFPFWSWSRAKTQSYLQWNLTSSPIMPLGWHRPSGKVQTPSGSHAYSVSSAAAITLLSCGQPHWHHPFNESSKSFSLTPIKWKISNKGDHQQGPVVRKHQDFIIILGGNDISHGARTSLSLTATIKGAYKGGWHK